jgi:gliding motility-associated-like protein
VFDIDIDIEVIILNRWGKDEFYYSGNSLAFEWNGLATNGNNLPSTDYYYIIKFNDNNYSDMTGVITLIR